MATIEGEVIRAAGALLWRKCSAHWEIAIVHRKRYNDWTLPKGKLNKGESWQEAAIREVREETGYAPTILDFAGAISYQVDGKLKVARFWHMEVNGNSDQKRDDEVDEVIWLLPEAALKRLQYPLEQALLEASQKKLPPQKVSNSIQRVWRNVFRPISLQRLGNTLDTVESDLDAVIEQVRISEKEFIGGWNQRSKHLLDTARQAYNEANAELGWRCLRAADRFMLFGLSTEQLKIEARSILIEANDERKKLSKWRKTIIQQLLGNDDGKLKDQIDLPDVVRAKRILDEHADNVYQKLYILKTRLQLLSIVSGLALLAWLIWPPFLPHSSVLASSQENSYLMWFGVILSGVLGALFSSFSSTISTDQTEKRIPSELSTSIITIARLSMATVTALAASIFLASGVFNIPKPNYEMMLAVAFVSGFSDRLLLRGIQSLAK